jgi:hypothetical protein
MDSEERSSKIHIQRCDRQQIIFVRKILEFMKVWNYLTGWSWSRILAFISFSLIFSCLTSTSEQHAEIIHREY